jgi:hypothetical protein
MENAESPLGPNLIMTARTGGAAIVNTSHAAPLHGSGSVKQIIRKIANAAVITNIVARLN